MLPQNTEKHYILYKSVIPDGWDRSITYLSENKNVPSYNIENSNEFVRKNLQSPYKFSIKKIDEESSHPAAGQKGLFAACEIPANKCIGQYTGGKLYPRKHPEKR